MTQENYSDLKTYIPESATVKMVFTEMHPEEDFKDWDETMQTLVNKAVGDDGDKETLFALLELTYLSGHNEGMLECQDNERGEF